MKFSLSFLSALSPRRALSWMRRHWILSIVGTLILIPIIIVIVNLMIPNTPEYVTATVRRGDLRQAVEAVGEVISERDLKLQFPITGIVDKVLLKEGDRVKAGQQIARLRAGGLAAEVSAASANVASAKAQLDEMERGTRPEEIAVAEAQVANSKASLESAKTTLENAEAQVRNSEQKLSALRSEAATALAGDVSSASSTITQRVTTASTAMRVIDDVLDNRAISDAIVRQAAKGYDVVKSSQTTADAALRTAIQGSSGIIDFEDALAALARGREGVQKASIAVDAAYGFVSAIPESSYFSLSDKEALKGTLAAERSSVQTALVGLDSALSSLRDASASYDTQIIAEESSLNNAEGSRDKAMADIRTYESSLRIQEAQLDLKKAGNRPEVIAAARARLNQAYADLQRAHERYSDTIIVAPIDGKITKINLKEGELLSTSFASDTAVTMLGDAPYRIEMFIAEIDIPKVRLGQSGSILLDAFPGKPFDLSVTELDPTATLIDGVPKYRAKLDFTEQDEGLRIGMTGDADVQTDFRGDVLIIPGRAVFTNDAGKKVVRLLQPDQSFIEQEVVVGMEGEGGDIEVLGGLQENQTIVVLVKE